MCLRGAMGFRVVFKTEEPIYSDFWHSKSTSIKLDAFAIPPTDVMQAPGAFRDA